MPIDIDLFRKDKGGDPDKIKASQRARFADEAIVDEIIRLDGVFRTAKYEFEGAKADKNKISKVVAEKKKASKGKDPCEEEVAQSKALDARIEELVSKREEAEKQLEKALGSIGNIVHKDVVISKTEDDNPVLRTWGEIPKDLVVNGEELGKLHHHQVMQCLDFIEMDRGSKVAGHRGYYLKGYGVMLNQALINYGIQTLAKKEYTACQAPFFMKKSIMEATCQLSDFSENLYQVEGTDDSEPLYLIATSEQPISAMHKGEWIEPSDLPMRYAGVSTCFRKEAGSHGRDVWGLFRIHQFEKVEQFIYCDPKKSWEELDHMVATSEEFYKALELPYQVIGLVSSELNDAAAMKMDLEAWFPGYNAYRELVSCSNCTDYQSRALDIRYALKNTDEKLYVHLLNGTLCATERTMCCIVENYQTPEGLRVPKVLQPFMGGVEFIPYNKKATDKFFSAMAEEKKREAQKAKKGGNKKAAKAPAAGKEEKKQAKEEPKKEQKKAAEQPQQPQKLVLTKSLAAPKASAKLDELERALALHQWVGGEAPTAADQEALEAISDNLPTPEMYPNVFFWYSMASKFDAKLRAKWTGGPAVAPAQQAAAKEETADDEDLDLFGSDDEEEKAQMERMKKAAAAAGKDKKKAVIAKSLIVWEVKPWGEETDLDELAKMILAIKVDGLEWKTEYKKEPIAYGVFKIVIGAVVEDEKVSTDDVAETIEAFEDHVQSVDIAAFNKL